MFRERLNVNKVSEVNPIDFVDSASAIPISLRAGVEYYAVVEDVVRQIGALSDIVKKEDASPC